MRRVDARLVTGSRRVSRLIAGGLPLRIVLALVSCAAAVGVSLPAVEGAIDDERAAHVKAAFVLNFARYTDWPDAAFAGSGDPVVIGVIGNTTVAEAVEKTVADQRIDGRRIAVRRLGPAGVMQHDAARFTAAAAGCQVLYFADPASAPLAARLAALGFEHVLTIGDGNRLAEAGVMLALLIDADRIVFAANPVAIRGSRVRVSSKVLQLARIVSPSAIAGSAEAD